MYASARCGKCSASSGQNPPLVLQQPLLAVETAGVAGERAIAADDTMTRNDDGDGVVSDRSAHRVCRLGTVDRHGNVPVAFRLAKRDFSQRLPDQPPALCASPGQE